MAFNFKIPNYKKIHLTEDESFAIIFKGNSIKSTFKRERNPSKVPLLIILLSCYSFK